MLNPVRFGAIIPIIGEEDAVARVGKAIQKRAEAEGVPTLFESCESRATYRYLPGTQEVDMEDPTETIQAAVVYTGKDVGRFQAFKAQLADYHRQVDVFIDRLYQAVSPIQPDTVKAWVQNNPWPTYPKETEFRFNIPKVFEEIKGMFEEDHPDYAEYQTVEAVEAKLQDGSLLLNTSGTEGG